ncbi:MAG: rhodanese-like domain-containing protein [Candidatus Thiodiazotropha sp. (ex Epidulcina cf. delphinae)]|nr:rhodanese-like domain-containing protein [Candidatus Thiodiazotropha sp. (ex Epidulcina cf. delphinae)]
MTTTVASRQTLFRIAGNPLFVALSLLCGALAADAPPYRIDGLDQPLPEVRDCNKAIGPSASPPPAQTYRPHHPSQASDEKIAFNCLSSVDAIHAQWKRENALLIDVRKPEAFRSNKIPGSVNIPLYQLKHTQGLGGRPIVLVNEGHRLRPLEEACTQLTAEGFEQVSVLDGGIKAWAEAGRAMTAAAQAALGDIEPAKFVSSLPEREWTLIDLDRSSQRLPPLPSTPGTIAHTGDFSSLSERIAAVKASRRPGRLVGFLVVSQDGADYGSVKKWFSDHGSKDIYYLSGGVNGFKRFAQRQSARLARQRKGFQVRMGCNGAT